MLTFADRSSLKIILTHTFPRIILNFNHILNIRTIIYIYIYSYNGFDKAIQAARKKTTLNLKENLITLSVIKFKALKNKR